MRRFSPVFLIAAFMACMVGSSIAQDLASFEKRTTVKVLKNGLTVVVCERPEAPVFSFATIVDAGSVQDPSGQSGLAHMFEHMAFKGTDRIGTTNYAQEKIALDKVEQAYAAYDREDRREVGRDPKKVAALKAEFDKAVENANKFVIKNRFGEIVEREGGIGLNAGTSLDSTDYLYSMPANRLELWAYLESERFRHPVFREFYKERDVVMEERRMRTESAPVGRLLEQFGSTAFLAHPYHNGVIGWPSDLNTFSASDGAAFFKKYYVPSNLVVAVVGDVKAADALPLLEKYFGRLPKGPVPEPLRTVEPPQKAERIVVLHEQAQPVY